MSGIHQPLFEYPESYRSLLFSVQQGEEEVVRDEHIVVPRPDVRKQAVEIMMAEVNFDPNAVDTPPNAIAYAYE